MDYIQLTYFWENDLSDLISIVAGNSIVSKPFCGSYQLTSFEFQLILYPNGYNNSYLALFLRYNKGAHEKIQNAKYTISFLNVNGLPSPVYTLKETNVELELGKLAGSEIISTNASTPNFRIQLGLTGNDRKVGIRCSVDVPLQFFQYRPPVPVLELEKRMTNLLQSVLHNNSNKFADVKLTSVDGRTFHCHRVVLSTSAPFFFEKLFESETTPEGPLDEINLPFVTGDALSEILRFIYENTIIPCNIKPIAEEILIASEMYKFDDLKKCCEICLFDDVNAKNAISMLQIAELYSLTDLKEKTICVVAENFITIGETDEWLNFMVEKTSLASEVIAHATKRMNVHVSPLQQEGVS